MSSRRYTIDVQQSRVFVRLICDRRQIDRQAAQAGRQAARRGGTGPSHVGHRVNALGQRRCMYYLSICPFSTTVHCSRQRAQGHLCVPYHTASATYNVTCNNTARAPHTKHRQTQSCLICNSIFIQNKTTFSNRTASIKIPMFSLKVSNVKSAS